VATKSQFGELDNKFEAKFGEFESKVDEKFELLESRLQDVEDGESRMSALGFSQAPPSGVPGGPWQAGAASVPPRGAPTPSPIPVPVVPLQAGQWDRLVDPSIIRFSSHAKAKVSLIAATASIDAYTHVRGIPKDTYKVRCLQGDIGTSFVLDFLGLPLLAATQVTEFFKGIKNPDASYYEFSALDPSDQKVVLHPNADKNGRMAKNEGATRRLAKQLKANYPILYPITDKKSKLFARRAEGILSHDFEELARLKVTPDAVTVHWNPKLAIKLGIDKSKESKEYNDAENIQWEV
jgi:hypothetical protein